MKYAFLSFIIVCSAACGTDTQPDRIADLDRALIEACPVGDPTDVAARDACGSALTDLPILREFAPNSLLWGGQPAGFSADELLTDANLTDLDPRIWTKMYLSTFMFVDTAPTVTTSGDYRIISLPVQFRYDLPVGDYPYPFWHSQPKWISYQTCTDVVLVIDRDDHIIAGVRSTMTDPARPQRERTWDGIWRWDNGAEPHVSLYSYLFSSDNPFIDRLDASYRALEEGLREHDCTMCHDPSNQGGAKHLEILSYPNQALTARHDAIRQVQLGVMPPATVEQPPGIADTAMREELIRLATDFADAGDAAFAYENW